MTISDMHSDELDGALQRWPPILTVKQAADLAQVSEKTIYDWISRGLLSSCSCKRGKRRRIWRDRFVRYLFGGK